MPTFTSTREKRLWLWVVAVVAAIFSTLVIGQPLLRLFADQNAQAVLFLLGMLLVGATIVAYWFLKKPNKVEVVLWLGIIAVYTMFFLRLGLPERSHLIEYSVLAIFIHLALTERARQGRRVPMPALLAFVLTFLIGVVDESIQILLPDRVFDPEDIVFNGMAAAMAIASLLIVRWIRKRVTAS